LGRRCRDTFATLKKTCRKLGVSFWEFPRDRVWGVGAVVPSGRYQYAALGVGVGAQ